MSAQIEKSVWQGEPVIRFSAGGYEAVMVPGIGANLISLVDPSRSLNILRTPPDIDTLRARPQVYGIPVLFPPNRIEDGFFKVGDLEYHMEITNVKQNCHLHGYLRNRPWNLVRAEVIGDAAEVEVAFISDKNSDFYDQFPHEFEARLVYKLSADGLQQNICFINNSERLMPMGLGYHTAFNVPFQEGSKEEDIKIKISVGKKWELTERTLPTGRILPVEGLDGSLRREGMPTQGHAYEAHFTAEALRLTEEEMEKLSANKAVGMSASEDAGMEGFHGAILTDNASGLQLIYEVGDEFAHWVIWNEKGNTGFICPEPQTWVINAPNVKLPEEITGYRLLQPGESWEGSTRIAVVG